MNKVLDVQPEHLEIICAILQKYLSPKATVWAFGSRTRNTARKFSDLDLAIDNGNGLPLPSSVMTNLAFDFEESNLPYKVDLVDWLAISDSFRERIKNDRIWICRGDLRSP